MMTTEELIIGHFNNTLTGSEQQTLQLQLEQSEHVRAQFEQHRHLHSELENDSRRIIPALWLESATLQSALGVATQTIGSSMGFWTGSKIIAVVVTAVVSGSGAGYFLSHSDNVVPKQPASISAPAKVPATTPASTPSVSPSVDASVTTTAPTTEAPASAPSVTRTRTATTSRGSQSSGTSVTSQRPLKLGDPDVNVYKGTEVAPPTNGSKKK